MGTVLFCTRARHGGVSLLSMPSQARLVLQGVLAILAAAAGIWLLYRLEHLVFLLILTMFFAYLVAPLVRLLERPWRVAGSERHVPRGLAVVLVYLLIAGAAAAGGSVLVPKIARQIGEAASQVPAYAASLRGWEQRWAGYYERSGVPDDIRQGIDRSVLGAGDAAVVYVRGSLMTLAGTLSSAPGLVLIPVLAFFLLKDAQLFRRDLIGALPSRFRPRGQQLFEDLNATLATYVRAQLLACALVGTVCSLGFAILDVPYPTLLGALAGVLEFIPLVGPFLAAVVATIVAALHAPVLAFWVVGFLGSLRLAQDYVIYPRLVGRRLHLHPLVVVIAVLSGLELNGAVGMFLAVPVVAVGSVIFTHWIRWREAERTVHEGG